MLALLSHLVSTFGVPLPVLARSSSEESSPYPCKNRRCGCRSAQECWAGDCCCFTLAEKLTWAETNGIEPPEHVRPRVEASQRQQARANRSSCCEAASSISPAEHSCCDATPSSRSCCLEQANSQKPPDFTTVDTPLPPDEASEPGLTWVVGIFAHQCHGDGPLGLWKSDPGLPPEPRFQKLISLKQDSIRDTPWSNPSSPSDSPPIPPPRLS